jgi:hypothetical protein
VCNQCLFSCIQRGMAVILRVSLIRNNIRNFKHPFRISTKTVKWNVLTNHCKQGHRYKILIFIIFINFDVEKIWMTQSLLKNTCIHTNNFCYTWTYTIIHNNYYFVFQSFQLIIFQHIKKLPYTVTFSYNGILGNCNIFTVQTGFH